MVGRGEFSQLPLHHLYVYSKGYPWYLFICYQMPLTLDQRPTLCQTNNYIHCGLILHGYQCLAIAAPMSVWSQYWDVLKQIYELHQKFQENVENFRLNFMGIMKYFRTVMNFFFMIVKLTKKKTKYRNFQKLMLILLLYHDSLLTFINLLAVSNAFMIIFGCNSNRAKFFG